MRRILTAGIALSAWVLLPVAPAAAQQKSTAAAPAGLAQATAQGPLVLEPIRSSYVIAPEVKITRVDGIARSLVGAYGGWLKDNSFLIGAGGYWLANRRTDHAGTDHAGTDQAGTNHAWTDDAGMYYGGVVLGWSVPAGRAVRFGVRALVGYGQATVPVTASLVTGHPDWNWDWGHDPHGPGPGDVNRQPRLRREFVIAEPQAGVTVRLGRAISLDAGAGYRAIGDAGGLERRLRGAFGSVGVRIGAH